MSQDYIDKYLEKEENLKDLVKHKHHIIKYNLDNAIEQQQTNSSREISFKIKQDKGDIGKNDKKYKEGKFCSKPKTADETIILSTINRKGKGEGISTSIQNNKDTIDYHLQHSKIASTYRITFSSKNEEDNYKDKHKFKQQHSYTDSKYKRDKILRNNIDNNTFKHEFELQKGKSKSTYEKSSMLRNNNDD